MTSPLQKFLGTISTPIGELSLIWSDAGLHYVDFTDPGHRRDQALAMHEPQSAPAKLIAATPYPEMFARYFAGDMAAFDGVTLALAGTVFQRKVWDALTRIRPGSTMTYGDLARENGHSGAARAVGSANGLNPIAIIIPCHRVIGADGRLAGYGGGKDRKRWLLTHEASPLFSRRQDK